MTTIVHNRSQSLSEEMANSISHGIGFLAAVALTPVLIINADSVTAIVAVSVFGATMMLLYLASTLYHAFPASGVKKLFQVFDHAAIFLLIAGTYTPFTLIVLKGAWGWTLFGVVWGLALMGVLLKSIYPGKNGRLSLALYIGMGWLAVVAVEPLVKHLPTAGLLWLLAGGIMYTSGVAFYAMDHRIRYGHFIWHLFVLAGTACHVAVILGYVI